MNPYGSSDFLRRVLLVDAAVSGAAGLLLAPAAGALEALLGLPASLLLYSGLVLLPFAALVAWLGTRTNPPHGAVRAVIGGNVLWVAASFLLLAFARVHPTAAGRVLVIGQALAVGVLAELEYFALRRASLPAGPGAPVQKTS
jgi:hypothetical protein